MLDTISATLQPIIVETLLALILAAIAWLMRKLPETMRVNIEEKHRKALHAALDTGIGYALDAMEITLRANPAVAVGDATVGRVLDYVNRSVPDAIRNLGPTQRMLQDMARAKLTEAVAKAGIDPLISALRNAGVNTGQHNGR